MSKLKMAKKWGWINAHVISPFLLGQLPANDERGIELSFKCVLQSNSTSGEKWKGESSESQEVSPFFSECHRVVCDAIRAYILSSSITCLSCIATLVSFNISS